MKKFPLFETLISITLILGITTVLYLYTSGYRLSKSETNNIDLTKTGMISVKSIPEGASVYLDGKLITATNDTVSSITPGAHTLKMVKKGYVEWNKQIEVYDELVTDITAVLVSQSPILEPLTNTGANAPAVSPTMTKLAYFTQDDDKPGIWIIPLGGPRISIFKSTPSIAIQDTKFTKYSQFNSIEWSPDEKELMVNGTNNLYYLVYLNTNTAQTTTAPESIRAGWAAEILKKRSDFVSGLNLQDNIKQLALSPTSMWSPDEKKFMYTVQNGDSLEYRVYDLEKPIPVGEKADDLVFTTKVSDMQPQVSWYSDSFHLIMVEGNVQKDSRGVISLIRIDGTNKTEIYNSVLMSDKVFCVPTGDKIIILTTFKSGGQEDLYTIGIRP